MESRPVDYVKSLCEEYIPSKREIPLIERDLDKLRRKLNEARNDADRRVISFGIQHREEDLERAQKVVAEYEYLVRGLDEDERNIITQLYSLGREWKQVIDTEGNSIHSMKISRIRKNALKHMNERLFRAQNLDNGFRSDYHSDDDKTGVIQRM